MLLVQIQQVEKVRFQQLELFQVQEMVPLYYANPVKNVFTQAIQMVQTQQVVGVLQQYNGLITRVPQIGVDLLTQQIYLNL